MNPQTLTTQLKAAEQYKVAYYLSLLDEKYLSQFKCKLFLPCDVRTFSHWDTGTCKFLVVVRRPNLKSVFWPSKVNVQQPNNSHSLVMCSVD